MEHHPVLAAQPALDEPRPESVAVCAPTAQARTPAGGTAVLLIDLQVDFLDSEHGRMPVSAAAAQRIVAAANRVLDGEVLPAALPVLIVNRFPAGSILGNLLRRGAAVAGSPGSRMDPRIATRPGVRLFAKQRANAFSNAELERYLRNAGVGKVWIVGVMSEACVRCTAVAARRLGFEVVVAEEGIATNASWKGRLATWLLRRSGVAVVPALPAAIPAEALPTATAHERSGRVGRHCAGPSAAGLR